jgi:hypothetical protein
MTGATTRPSAHASRGASALAVARAFAVAIGTAPFIPTPALTQAAITIDPGTVHQTVTGWEGTAWAAHYTLPSSPDYNPAFPYYRDAVYDSLVDEIGVNRLRLEIRSGVENDQDWWMMYQTGLIDYPTWRSHRYSTVNDNSDPYTIDWNGFHFSEMDSTIDLVVLPLKERVEANGEHLHVNVNYVAFTGQIGGGLDYHHDDPEEYAEFVLATWLHLQSRYGWAPDSWELILEPDNVSQWSGDLIGQAIVAVAGRLDDYGWDPPCVVPSNTNMGAAITYFDQLIAVPGALPHVSELSYHRYGGVSDANLQAIADRGVAHGIDTAMLEWWSSGNTYATLHKDLDLGRNSAWQQGVVCGIWNGSGDTPFCWVDDADPENPTVWLNEKSRFNRQYFAFVRSGAIRIGATSTNGGFAPLAFANLDGRNVVVVKADGGGAIEIHGLPEGTYGITYTTETQYSATHPDQAIGAGETLATTIPARGVITVHGRSAVTSAAEGANARAGVRLGPPAPNPFASATAFRYALAAGGRVRLTIHDPAGRLVRTLMDAFAARGEHVIRWDGTDSGGRPVASGAYTYRLRASGVTRSTKVVVVR